MGSLKFTDRILDNVHGFIDYTDTEKAIMDTLLFKRLQSIKQLSIANWIFPGSEHTRYIHSLGVMHIADRIAKQLELSEDDRKIIRLAGLLHDIGHYPLSHVCEQPYKKDKAVYNANSFCQESNLNVKDEIDNFNLKTTLEFMKESTGGHHENIGALIIKNDREIRDIIERECKEGAIDIICDMITGSTKRSSTNPLWVQILHSEIDADGIDYMMRDAAFSGTGFGSFELDQLIRCLQKRVYNGKEILCINEKGIAAADQYLINKFFSYSQVVFNKHISNLEWMSEKVVRWMQTEDEMFPSKNRLLTKWINNNGKLHSYLNFTDTFFWKRLDEAVTKPPDYNMPEYVKIICEMLLHHQELDYIKNGEVRIVSKDEKEIKKLVKESLLYQELINSDDKIVIMEQRELTKHVPIDIFKDTLKRLGSTKDIKDIKEDYINDRLMYRFMEGMCVCSDNNDEIHLLCDDSRSLMKQLYGTTLVICRAFNFPVKDTDKVQGTYLNLS